MPILLSRIENLSLDLQIIFLAIGVLALFFVFLMIFLYRKKLKKESDSKNNFQMSETKVKYQIFYFWGHVIYLLIIFTSFIISFIFLTIFIGSFF